MFRAPVRVLSRSLLSGAPLRRVTYYTKDHEYIKVNGSTATLGVSDFAQAALGDVVYVSLPAQGAAVKKGESFASVESVKATSDVYTPVTGTVTEVNTTIDGEPALVNSSPEDKAWFVKVEMSNPEEVKGMMDAAAYKAFCESEAAHH